MIAPGRIESVFQVFQLVIALLYLMILVWLFPVLARFENTTLNIIQSAFFLSIRHFGFTLMMIVTSISITLIEFFYAPVLALWGMGLIAYVNCICARAVFARYVPEDGDPSQEPLNELFPEVDDPSQEPLNELFPEDGEMPQDELLPEEDVLRRKPQSEPVSEDGSK